MLDIILRPLKDIVVDPLILGLKYLKVSPNVFTMLSGLCGKNKMIFEHYRSNRSILFNLTLVMGVLRDVFTDSPPRWHRWSLCEGYQSVY